MKSSDYRAVVAVFDRKKTRANMKLYIKEK